jgi:hypothetical protein
MQNVLNSRATRIVHGLRLATGLHAFVATQHPDEKFKNCDIVSLVEIKGTTCSVQLYRGLCFPWQHPQALLCLLSQPTVNNQVNESNRLTVLLPHQTEILSTSPALLTASSPACAQRLWKILPARWQRKVSLFSASAFSDQLSINIPAMHAYLPRNCSFRLPPNHHHGLSLVSSKHSL